MYFALLLIFHRVFTCSSDTSDIGCSSTCVGPHKLSCESLLAGSQTEIVSTTCIEMSFSASTTITGVSIVLAGVSDSPSWVRIGHTATDTTSELYEGSAPYSIVADESTFNVTEMMVLLQEDFYLDSNSWMVEIGVANGAPVVVESIVISGGSAPLFSAWGNWSSCYCGLQTRSRTCNSDSGAICDNYSIESLSCNVCTCELNSNMVCSAHSTGGIEGCNKILDSDSTTLWIYDFPDSSTKKDVVFEFRDDTGNEVALRVESLSWNLTTDTDVNDFEWKLITTVDPDEPIADSTLSRMGPYPITSRNALWSLGAGKETRLLWFEFYPTTDAKTSRLGINEIIVTGVPSGECGNNDNNDNNGAEHSHELVVSVSVMLVVGISMFVSMLIVAWWCQCGCFKRKIIEARMTTQRTLRDLKEMYTLTSTQSHLEGQPGASIDYREREERLSPSVKNIYQAGTDNQGLFSTDFCSTEDQISASNDRPHIRILTSLRGEKHVYRPQSYNCYEALVAWVEEEYLELSEDKWYLQGMDSDKLISSDKSVSEALAKAEKKGDTKLRLLIKTSTLVV